MFFGSWESDFKKETMVYDSKLNFDWFQVKTNRGSFQKTSNTPFSGFFPKNWWNEFFCQNNLINCQFLGISPLDWMQNNKEKLMILFYKKSVTNSPTYWQTARWADQQWNNRTSCGSGSAINNNDWDKECEGCKLRLWFYLWSFLLSALTSF